MESNSFIKVLRGVLCGCAVVGAMAVATAAPAQPVALEEIKSRLGAQREKIRSLHVRLRRETTISVEPDVLLGWPHRFTLPEYLGTDEVLFAFKGRKRYRRRIVASDYTPTAGYQYDRTTLGRPSAEIPRWLLPYIGRVRGWTVDEAAACDAETFFERKRAQFGAPFVYRSAPLSDVPGSLPPAEYLMNVGLAVSDPTGKDQAQRNLQQMGLLPDLLQRWPYAVSDETAQIEGTPCVVLEGRMECRLPAADDSMQTRIEDKLWLSLKHGLAVRKRETRVDGQLRHVLNSDFVEVLPGFWLPRRSRTETFAPPTAPKTFHDRPVCVRDMKLCLWVVNQTPDDFFGTALPKAHRPVSTIKRATGRPLDLTPAFHYRLVLWRELGKHPGEIRDGTEIWAVRGVGWRREFRKGSKLRSLDVDTGRWAFTWEPARNRVRAFPSVGDSVPSLPWVIDRATLMRESEELTGVFASQDERLRGKKVEKLTVYYPAERRPEGGWINTHDIYPQVQLKATGMEFCTRQHWFDPKTHLRVQFICGCKPPGYRVTIDYPPPQSIPRKLFTFEVPRDSLLEVDDPALGRRIRSEGPAETDLRQ